MKPATSKRTGPRRRATGKAAAASSRSIKAKAGESRTKTKRQAELEPTRTAQEAAATGAAVSEAALSAERDQAGAASAVSGAAISRTVGETTDLTKTAVNAWTESGAIVARGMEDIGMAWLRYMQRSVADGVAAARALLAARSLREAVDLQSEYARNSLGSLVSESVRLSELSVKVAREAMQPLKSRLDAAAGRVS